MATIVLITTPWQLVMGVTIAFAGITGSCSSGGGSKPGPADEEEAHVAWCIVVVVVVSSLATRFGTVGETSGTSKGGGLPAVRPRL